MLSSRLRLKAAAKQVVRARVKYTSAEEAGFYKAKLVEVQKYLEGLQPDPRFELDRKKVLRSLAVVLDDYAMLQEAFRDDPNVFKGRAGATIAREGDLLVLRDGGNRFSYRIDLLYIDERGNYRSKDTGKVLSTNKILKANWGNNLFSYIIRL